jgi:hypothetical protein
LKNSKKSSTKKKSTIKKVLPKAKKKGKLAIIKDKTMAVARKGVSMVKSIFSIVKTIVKTVVKSVAFAAKTFIGASKLVGGAVVGSGKLVFSAASKLI